MGGDGMGGLVVLILIASILLLVAPAAILFFGALALAKKSKHCVPIALASATLGTAIGFVAVAATFFESSFSPRNRLVLQLPPETKHEWVVLLEKPGAAQRLEWRGVNLPFMSKSANVVVPASGVVIVDSLDGAGGGHADGFTLSGEMYTGQSGGPAPQASGYTTYLALLRPDLPTNSSSLPPLRELHDATNFALFLKERGITK
ncbi:MAG: hypothetical protein ACRDAM_12365 [Casimicrobium sp.]